MSRLESFAGVSLMLTSFGICVCISSSNILTLLQPLYKSGCTDEICMKSLLLKEQHMLNFQNTRENIISHPAWISFFLMHLTPSLGARSYRWTCFYSDRQRQLNGAPVTRLQKHQLACRRAARGNGVKCGFCSGALLSLSWHSVFGMKTSQSNRSRQIWFERSDSPELAYSCRTCVCFMPCSKLSD